MCALRYCRTRLVTGATNGRFDYQIPFGRAQAESLVASQGGVAMGWPQVVRTFTAIGVEIA